jgi:hypothetical protein
MRIALQRLLRRERVSGSARIIPIHRALWLNVGIPALNCARSAASLPVVVKTIESGLFRFVFLRTTPTQNASRDVQDIAPSRPRISRGRSLRGPRPADSGTEQKQVTPAGLLVRPLGPVSTHTIDAAGGPRQPARAIHASPAVGWSDQARNRSSTSCLFRNDSPLERGHLAPYAGPVQGSVSTLSTNGKAVHAIEDMGLSPAGEFATLRGRLADALGPSNALQHRRLRCRNQRVRHFATHSDEKVPKDIEARRPPA